MRPICCEGISRVASPPLEAVKGRVEIFFRLSRPPCGKKYYPTLTAGSLRATLELEALGILARGLCPHGEWD